MPRNGRRNTTGTVVYDQVTTSVQNNWRQLLVAGKYGIEYSLASASDGLCRHGWGLTLKMEFPHFRFSTLTTDALVWCLSVRLSVGLSGRTYMPTTARWFTEDNTNATVVCVAHFLTSWELYQSTSQPKYLISVEQTVTDYNLQRRQHNV